MMDEEWCSLKFIIIHNFYYKFFIHYIALNKMVNKLLLFKIQGLFNYLTKCNKSTYQEMIIKFI
jgi:hypothetical protein